MLMAPSALSVTRSELVTETGWPDSPAESMVSYLSGCASALPSPCKNPIT